MSRIILMFAFGAALVSGCQSPAMPSGECQPRSEKLAARNPEAEAELAIRSASPYLLAVQGYSISFPGVDDPQVAMRIGYRTLEGTGDAIRDESCRAYQRAAMRFAERFNRRLMVLLPASAEVAPKAD